MRRRVKPVPVTDAGVPVLIAAGPHIPTWADSEQLAKLEKQHPDEPERETTASRCELSARRRWAQARRDWLEANAVPHAKQCALIPLRRPFWDSAP